MESGPWSLREARRLAPSTPSPGPMDGTRQEGLPLAKIDDFRATSGFGAEALVMGQKVRRS